ncbi:DUF3857 domain-containing protein [Serratia entomophila]|uniref:DUF3857 domain-containing protein n=1 Tax=Serratia entomophila TaxID=42906 RepID=UPI002178D601|nr:DUF3857 domain-containing protein [Serratia entomophila]CAI0903789.1 Uncharacterized protein involved in cytokinesis, contains TGc (transglutaminase/protease-like) domain [Serratia entomophila]CAI1540695.1 Uncharacterized protein involved in cytokinesis, contains TGc (transglutaminase/protease-like) domain [Serratia entomophila]CAI1591010.1 Uncharacterized protein involved in cytokinesis, contains TGc (transglutaminase/protease-like) domain [Serratia entomophila]CAI1593959.1 Uncharacterized 
MKTAIPSILLLAGLTAAHPATLLAAEAAAPAETAAQEDAASNDFSYVRYRADYQVLANAHSVKTESYEILLKTKAAVEKFSQIRLGYSEKMETLEVVSAYTLTADGQRHDVAPDRIYTQESYSSASAPLYADRKVRVIVFSNLAPGSRIVYQLRQTQNVPYFPGYFGLWETFSVFDQFDDAEINLQAPARLPMNIFTRGVEGGDQPQIRDGQAHWRWHYQRSTPLKAQNWAASSWTFSPTIMASTYREWPQLAKAYQLKASQAAKVTPGVQALADQITAGVTDRREQAAAIYRWVAQNIRYVAVYLGNGGLEPNSAQSILDNHYGDCKDHVVLLEALLAAKGIESSPVLIGMDEGPILPKVPLLGRFNHAITYVPEFNLYLDSTNPWARFGQLPEGDLSAPVLLTREARLARTPSNDEQRNQHALSVDFQFDKTGNMRGQTERPLSEVEEIDLRGYFSQINRQNRARAEESIMTSSGIDGRGQVVMHGDPLDLKKQFGFSFRFKADDYVDFGVVGGMRVPSPPGGKSFRSLYTSTAAPNNETPFYCNAQRYEETYRLQLPANVPIIAIPKDLQFRNAAGDYRVEWRRDGQQVTVNHRLQMNAIRGKEALCQAQDYPAFRELFQQVRRGFRGQVVYGELANGAVSQAGG